jgi:hypothetical protein
MPQGVKSNLTDAEKYEKHLKRCAEYKRNKRLNDPEYAQKIKDYNNEYWRKIRQAGRDARVAKTNETE